MKKNNITSILLALTCATNTAFAVSNSVDMNPADYQDYLVQLQNNKGATCGGALVNGKFLVTARHCVENGPRSLDTAPESIDAVSVWQSPHYHAPKTEGHYFTAKNPIPYFANNHSYVPLMTKRMAWVDTLEGFYPGGVLIDYEYFADMVVIKLGDSAILNQSTATAFVEMVDFSGTSPILAASKGDKLTFNGWGVDENGTPLEMGNLAKNATVTIGELPPYGQIDKYGQADHIVYANPQTTVEFDDGSHTTPGDSGTPIVMGYETVGLVVNGGIFGKSVGLQSFTGLLPFLAESINDISTVTQLKTTAQTGQWSFPVQNLTTSKLTLERTVSDGVITVSDDCTSDMETGEYCTLTVNATAIDTDAFSGDITLLYNGKIRVIPVLLNAVAEKALTNPLTNPVIKPTTSESSNNNSSGGSMGVWGLILLMLVSVRRFKA